MLHWLERLSIPVRRRFRSCMWTPAGSFRPCTIFGIAGKRKWHGSVGAHQSRGVAKNINPFDHGSAIHTDVMKTQGLKQALDAHGFDVAFGGARRDEEKSRAKEQIFVS